MSEPGRLDPGEFGARLGRRIEDASSAGALAGVVMRRNGGTLRGEPAPGSGRPGSLAPLFNSQLVTQNSQLDMFRIKICGITNVDDAAAAVDAGADAIGLNFYEKSPRFLSTPAALEIVRSVGAARVHRVGVFVNMDETELEQIAASLALNAIQLHGDETPEVVARVAKPRLHPLLHLPLPIDVIRARRLDVRGVAAIVSDLDASAAAGGRPSAVLVDAAMAGCYGGTGETVSWVGLADHRRWLGDIPLILAGGLTPDNVAEAIRIVRPAAVDVASGVESAPGKKDPHKVRDFVAVAEAAFGAIEPQG